MSGSTIPPAASGCPKEWERMVSATYYRQEVRTPRPEDFEGRLSVLQLGPLSLSRIRSSPVTYRRRASQIRRQVENHHLITIPLSGDLFFEQRDRTSRCPANCFVTERGDLPYELHQPGRNELLVVKVPESLLDGHLPCGTAFAGHVIGPHTGFAGLFIDYARALMSRDQDFGAGRDGVVGRHLVELLAAALSDERGGLESTETGVRDAHLRRIKAAIRQRLYDPELTPAAIAASCQLSVRYLHRLFAATGTTMGRWLIEQRLMECDGLLRDPRGRESLASVAQRHGFYDQSQFCRHYRRRFGCTPRETRDRARREAGIA